MMLDNGKLVRLFSLVVTGLGTASRRYHLKCAQSYFDEFGLNVGDVLGICLDPAGRQLLIRCDCPAHTCPALRPALSRLQKLHKERLAQQDVAFLAGLAATTAAAKVQQEPAECGSEYRALQAAKMAVAAALEKAAVTEKAPFRAKDEDNLRRAALAGEATTAKLEKERARHAAKAKLDEEKSQQAADAAATGAAKLEEERIEHAAATKLDEERSRQAADAAAAAAVELEEERTQLAAAETLDKELSRQAADAAVALAGAELEDERVRQAAAAKLAEWRSRQEADAAAAAAAAKPEEERSREAAAPPVAPAAAAKFQEELKVQCVRLTSAAQSEKLKVLLVKEITGVDLILGMLDLPADQVLSRKNKDIFPRDR